MYELKRGNRGILLLLRAMAVSYPILKFYGLILPKILVLVVREGQGIRVMNLLSDHRTQKIDECMRNRDVIRVLSETNSDFAMYFYAPTRKGNDRLTDLITAARNGQIAGCEVNALILVVTEGVPRGISLDDVFMICLDGELSDVKFITENEVVPFDEQIPVVVDRMSSVLHGSDSIEKAVFRSAACFLYPCLPEENRETEFQYFLNVADTVVELSDACEGDADMGTLVLKELNIWQEDTGFSAVCELPYLDEQASSNLDWVILYDDRYVYIPEKLFKYAVRQLLETIPVMIVMSGMEQSGLLVSGSERTYTVKVCYYDSKKKRRCKRCLRLQRQYLKCLGEQGFIERCLT